MGTQISIGPGLDTREVAEPAPLEERDNHAVGRSDRQQVHDHCLERNQERPEHDRQQDEGQREDSRRRRSGSAQPRRRTCRRWPRHDRSRARRYRPTPRWREGLRRGVGGRAESSTRPGVRLSGGRASARPSACRARSAVARGSIRSPGSAAASVVHARRARRRRRSR